MGLVGTRAAAAAGGDARLLIEALYQVAADPESWEQLIDALAGVCDDAPPPAVAAELGRIHGLAELVRRPGEGVDPTPPGRVDMGWLVVSARGKLLAASPAAREALEPAVARLSPGSQIAFADPANREAFTRAMAEARRSGRQAILRLERDADSAPAFAYVASAGLLEAAAGARAEPGAFAVVFPAADPATQLWSSIRDSFGLTPAEVRLAQRLREGLTLAEAAETLEVSVNTVRNQLRAIFDKMGLKRQADLVRALTELAGLAGALGAPPAAQAGAAPPVRFVRLGDGRRLAYRDYGAPDGRPVLAFHEGMGSSLMPPGLDERARALGLRVVCAERPGFGQSDRRAEYGFDAVAEDMVELCDRLGLREVAVSGLMSGAPSALATAARLGARARLVLICSGRSPRRSERRSVGPLEAFRARLETHPWVVESFYAILRLRLSPALVRRMMTRSAEFSASDRAWFAQNPEISEHVAAYVAECLANGARGIADELKAFQRAQNMTVAGLAAPVVVWHGEEDSFTRLDDMLAYLGGGAAETRVLEGIGHMAPARYWPQMLERLAQGA